jgi:hypothetical protein
MIAIAGAALLIKVVTSWEPPEMHSGFSYFGSGAVYYRKFERANRREGASARASAEAARHKARDTIGAERERLENEAKRFEENAARFDEAADSWARDAVEKLERLRARGYVPSELPDAYRKELNPEDLKP